MYSSVSFNTRNPPTGFMTFCFTWLFLYFLNLPQSGEGDFLLGDLDNDLEGLLFGGYFRGGDLECFLSGDLEYLLVNGECLL